MTRIPSSSQNTGRFYSRLQALLFLISFAAAIPWAQAQVETVATSPQRYVWESHGRVDGHLALDYSPAGAFAPDGKTLAIVNQDKVVLMSLPDANVQTVLHPKLKGIKDLTIYSANFIGPNVVFLLGGGLVPAQGKGVPNDTPLLGFRWDTQKDVLVGKVDVIGAGGGFAPALYLPEIGFLGLYKDSTFILWNPATGQSLETKIPGLTRQPRLYTFSPDGHWLIVAQIEGSGPDPVVVRLQTHEFVNSLRGHQGTVMSVSFSRDSQRVVTACEDGKVRIWSAPDWKLLETLAGHQGPVHWAEFSPDGQWVASGGEDQTVRIWSVADGKLLQTLSESQQPIRTVAFSPDSQSLAASTQQTVLVWRRIPVSQ